MALEPTSSGRTCPQCGAVIAAIAAEGLCPRCLFGQIGQQAVAGQATSAVQGIDADWVAGERSELGDDELTQAPGQAGWSRDSDKPSPQTATGPPPGALNESAGAVIGRYKLLEKLGEGGFGVVWAAEQREAVRRRVALKIIKLGMDTRQVVARFEAERQALAVMDHPNIAKVLDAGATETGRPYFVMELVKGIPITRYCEREKLDTAARLDLFIRVCQAIQHAHQKGIIHRDIKPSNILVTLHDGVPVPKVIDFGIAKATQAELTEKTIYTQFNQFIGTPAYMSPEQAELSGLDIDTRSDIYSLGVLLYELLTGSTPFDTKELLQSGVDEMRRIIREREPVRPSTRFTQELSGRKSEIRTLNSEIDRDLDWIVMKCLEKDRGRRYETANGLAADLKRHLDNEPVTARPPSATYRFQKAFRRNKLAFAAGAAVAAALLAGAMVASWQAVSATRARNQAVLAEQRESEQRVEAEAARQEATSQRDLAQERLLNSLLREMRAIATARPLGFRSQLKDRVRQALELPGSAGRLDALRSEFTRGLGDPLGFDPVEIAWDPPLGEQELAHLQLSPDGRLAATWTGSHGLGLRETARAGQVAHLGLQGETPVSMAFSPDSRTFHAVVERVVAVRDGEPLRPTQFEFREWRQNDDGSWGLHSTSPTTAGVLLQSREGVFLLRPVADDPRLAELVDATAGEELVTHRLPGMWGRIGEDRRMISVAPRTGWITGRWERTGTTEARDNIGIDVWSLKTSEHHVRLEPLPGMGVYFAARFSPDERYLVCTGGSGLAVYETQGFSVVARAFAYLGDASPGAVFVRDGSAVAIAEPQRAVIRLVSISTGDSTSLPVVAANPELHASADGSMLVYSAGLLFRRQFLVPLRDTAERIRLTEHAGGVTAAGFAPGGRLLATTGKDGAIRFWDPAMGRLLRTISRTNALGQTLGFSPDGRWLAVGDSAHTQIEILSVDGGGQRLTLGEPRPGFTWGCGFSPDGRWLVAVGSGGIGVRIWELAPVAGRSGDFPWEPKLVEQSPGNHHNLVFDPDGRWFAYAGQAVDGSSSLFVRRLDPPFEVRTLVLPAFSPVQSLDVMPGLRQLVLGELDSYDLLEPGVARPLRFIDLERLAVIRSVSLLAEGERMTAHTVNLRVSPDGLRLATVSHDGRRVHICDAASGRRLYSLGEDPGVVWWLAWQPDGHRLVVTRDTGDVSIWKLPDVKAALAAVGLEP